MADGAVARGRSHSGHFVRLAAIRNPQSPISHTGRWSASTQAPGDPGCQSSRPMLRRHRANGGNGWSMAEAIGGGDNYLQSAMEERRDSGGLRPPFSATQSNVAAARKRTLDQCFQYPSTNNSVADDGKSLALIMVVKSCQGRTPISAASSQTASHSSQKNIHSSVFVMLALWITP